MTAPVQQKVFIVEDDEAIREWLAESFASMHWQVKGVEDGQEALEVLCHEKDFDLVLLDVWLPNMNGLEVLRTLRGLGVASPVIMMTAYGASFDPDHALQLGASAILLKPFSMDQLEKKVEELIPGSTKSGVPH